MLTQDMHIRIFSGLGDNCRIWQANLLLSSGEEVLGGSEVEVIQLDVYFTFVAWRR
jgi:hypothetical protein